MNTRTILLGAAALWLTISSFWLLSLRDGSKPAAEPPKSVVAEQCKPAPETAVTKPVAKSEAKPKRRAKRTRKVQRKRNYTPVPAPVPAPQVQVQVPKPIIQFPWFNWGQ